MNRRPIVTWLLAALILIAMPATVAAQDKRNETSSQIAVKLVLENDFVRVNRYEGSTDASPDERLNDDAVLVRIATGKDLDPAGGNYGQPEIRFVPRGQSLQQAGFSAAETFLLVELKGHWDAEVKTCAAPLTCSRVIKAGTEEIGETRSLFTNGFISGFFHRLERGATLSSSYYSASGADRIVYVPLTDLKVNFGGRDEVLKTGQPYFSDAPEVETTAGDHSVSWVIVRIHTPKK